MEELKQQLQQAGIPCREAESLAAHCTFKIGGPAKLFVQPRTEEELCSAIGICKSCGVRYYLLGNGSNILFADEGYDGAVIDITALETGIGITGTELSAGAGVRLSALCKAALEQGLTGLEFAYGIPGTVGGAVYMNAGAYGGEMKQVVERVHFLEADGTPGVMSGEDLAFGYRKSAFMGTKRIITSAELRLESGAEAEITAKMEDFMRRRREKQPLELPSAGSVFKRPEGYFAGALIEQCGLKGFAVGGACVSEKHAGFIVNKGGATCADVEALIRAIQDTVFQATGVELEPEIRRISLSE